MVLGAVGGRSARHIRYLAERLAGEGDEPSDELRRALTSPVALVVNYASLAAALALLALMIWATDPVRPDPRLPASSPRPRCRRLRRRRAVRGRAVARLTSLSVVVATPLATVVIGGAQRTRTRPD
jgi:hypothetical protein